MNLLKVKFTAAETVDEVRSQNACKDMCLCEETVTDIVCGWSVCAFLFVFVRERVVCVSPQV